MAALLSYGVDSPAYSASWSEALSVTGSPAIDETIFAGMPVSVTLLFSREHYIAATAASDWTIRCRLRTCPIDRLRPASIAQMTQP